MAQGDGQNITAGSHLSVPELSTACLLRLAPVSGLLWEACPCCWEPGREVSPGAGSTPAGSGVSVKQGKPRDVGHVDSCAQGTQQGRQLLNTAD